MRIDDRAQERHRIAGSDPAGGNRRGLDQSALPVADQSRQYLEPDRPLRHLRHRASHRDHDRRHRPFGRLGDRPAGRALRRPSGQCRHALAAGAPADPAHGDRDRTRARPAHRQAEDPALHRDALRPADLSRHCALLYRGCNGGLQLRPELSDPGVAHRGPVLRRAPLFPCLARWSPS